jgi:hypothetical protein
MVRSSKGSTEYKAVAPISAYNGAGFRRRALIRTVFYDTHAPLARRQPPPATAPPRRIAGTTADPEASKSGNGDL